MNNYEKIKSMSIDEMAEFIDKYFACFLCDTLLNKKNTDCEKFFQEIHFRRSYDSAGCANGRYRTRFNHGVSAVQPAASGCPLNKKDSHPKVTVYGGRYRTRTYDLPHVKRML